MAMEDVPLVCDASKTRSRQVTWVLNLRLQCTSTLIAALEITWVMYVLIMRLNGSEAHLRKLPQNFHVLEEPLIPVRTTCKFILDSEIGFSANKMLKERERHGVMHKHAPNRFLSLKVLWQLIIHAPVLIFRVNTSTRRAMVSSVKRSLYYLTR